MSDNIGFPTIQESILCRLIEELNTVSNGLVVMGVRGVIRAAGGLRRLKTVCVFVLRRSLSRFAGSGRSREDQTHEDLSEAIKELHGWEVEVEVEVIWRGRLWVRTFFTVCNYFYDEAVSSRIVHCLLCMYLCLTAPGSVMLWWMSSGF